MTMFAAPQGIKDGGWNTHANCLSHDNPKQGYIIADVGVIFLGKYICIYVYGTS